MISIFTSKNQKSFQRAKAILEDNGISHYIKEDYLSNLNYTSYKIFIEEKDVERTVEVLRNVPEETLYYYEDFDLAGLAVVFMVLMLILTTFWIQSY